MKKRNVIVLVVIGLVVLVGVGAYFIFMSPSATKNNNQTNTVSNEVVITKNNSSLGNYLADPNGAALYIYNSDTSGASNCTGTCLTTWPPYQDKGTTTNLPANIGVITRTDNGEIQYTYQGMPLYYYTGDTGGQVNGNNLQNFQIAQPVSSTQTSTSSSQSSSNTTLGY